MKQLKFLIQSEFFISKNRFFIKEFTMPWIKESECAGCGICVNICPSNAIIMTGGVAVIKQELCTKCGSCLNICPKGIILPNSENSSLKGSGRNRGKGTGRNRRNY